MPGTVAAFNPQQLQGDLIDLGDFQLLQQRVAQGPVKQQAVLKLVLATKAQSFKRIDQAGQVQHAKGDPCPLENILVASASFLQCALALRMLANASSGSRAQIRPSRHLLIRAGNSC